MSESITHLLELVDQFPKRVRIDYDENDDRMFCNNVLTALVKAAPDIRALMLPSQSVPPVVGGLPSIGIVLPSPMSGNSSHILSPTLDKVRWNGPEAERAGTAEVSDHTPGTDGKPESAGATPDPQSVEPLPPTPPEEKPPTTKATGRGKQSKKPSSPGGEKA